MEMILILKLIHIFISVMQAGFACLESGAVRTKNSLNIIMKNLLDLRKYKKCY